MRTAAPQPAKAVLALRPDLTQRGLAQKLGKSEHWVGRVLNGYERPSPELARAMAVVFGVPPEMLFRPEDLPEAVGT